VRVEQGQAQVRDAQRLLARSDHLPERHQELVRFLLDLDPVPWERLGAHLVGACDAALVAAHGARCLTAASRTERGPSRVFGCLCGPSSRVGSRGTGHS
jgi:hypothetical protein